MSKKKKVSLKKTKIVCTIGPATNDQKIIEELIKEGMNVARINMSHGGYDEHEKQITSIKRAREKLNEPIAIMLDTKGPEIRTGDLQNGSVVDLKAGQQFILTTEDLYGDESIVSITYKELPEDLSPGNTILLDDGEIGLKVDKIDGPNIICTVQNDGELGQRKSINIPGIELNLPGLTEKDINDLKFGIQQGVDFIAASFIRRPDDVLTIRDVLDSNNGSDIKIISKIESEEGVYNINDIIAVSDGIMVARGDLGVEVPAKDVPVIQKTIIRKCNKAAKPVITATQMLDSMIHNPRPTRAEVADVANAVFDGTDAVMLSGETAMGEYPVEVVKTMADIASVAEVADQFRLEANLKKKRNGISNAVCDAAVTMSVSLNSNSIIANTASGETARQLSKFKPDANIYATSFREITIRQVSLSWGVYGVYISQINNSDMLVRESVRAVREKGYIKSGERVIVAAGIPVGASSVTNMLRVVKIGHSELQGVGNGEKKTYIGIAKQMRVSNLEAEENFNEGDILVVPRITSSNKYLASIAGGIITEDDYEVSEKFLKDINTPIISSVDDVFENLTDGTLITIDSETGTIKQGVRNYD